MRRLTSALTRNLCILLAIATLLLAMIAPRAAIVRGPVVDLVSRVVQETTSGPLASVTGADEKLPMEWRVAIAAMANILKHESHCPGKNRYQVQFGCTEIPLEDMPTDGSHPRVPVSLDNLRGYEGQTSDAFGIGQFLGSTWDRTNEYCGGALTDIRDPAIQELGVICNMGRVGALQQLLNNAVHNPRDDSYTVPEKYYKRFLCYVGREWAGTPFSGWGQMNGVNSEKWKFDTATNKWRFDCASDADWAKYDAAPASYTSPTLYKDFWDDFNAQLAIQNQRTLREFLPESQTASEFIFPLAGLTWDTASVGDKFGLIPTSSGGTRNHAGQDFPIEAGHKILATEAMYIGKVYTNPSATACGIGMFGVGGENRSWLGCHMSEVYVTEGQRVEQGEVIGLTGSTGNSTGNHYHIELRIDGTNIDPAPSLKTARRGNA